MTDTARGKTSLKEEFLSLKLKQMVGLVTALVLCLILEWIGFGVSMSCFGFFIIAVVLYMVPHLLGVTSVKIKGILGVLFVVLALMIGTFAYPHIADSTLTVQDSNEHLRSAEIDDGYLIVVTDESIPGAKVTAEYAPVTTASFGYLMAYDNEKIQKAELTHEGGQYTATLLLEDGKLYYIIAQLRDADDNVLESIPFTCNTGISDDDIRSINFGGAAVTVAESAIIFFLVLIFSAVMRRSVQKSRTKMEKDGRLYPQGYGRCKECNAMVLPGEITCRKCGAYIDVPDEMRPKKKDFFYCSECGAEVPNDAIACPKCGVKFDEETENEVEHENGAVDTTVETFECSECGAIVPANAVRCPKCGAKFDEEDE